MTLQASPSSPMPSQKELDAQTERALFNMFVEESDIVYAVDDKGKPHFFLQTRVDEKLPEPRCVGLR